MSYPPCQAHLLSTAATALSLQGDATASLEPMAGQPVGGDSGDCGRSLMPERGVRSEAEHRAPRAPEPQANGDAERSDRRGQARAGDAELKRRTRGAARLPASCRARSLGKGEKQIRAVAGVRVLCDVLASTVRAMASEASRVNQLNFPRSLHSAESCMILFL